MVSPNFFLIFFRSQNVRRKSNGVGNSEEKTPKQKESLLEKPKLMKWREIPGKQHYLSNSLCLICLLNDKQGWLNW